MTYGALGGAVAVGAFGLAPLALGAYGFSAAGVVGGSAAAAAQASIGNVFAGSSFAVLQSVGAAGFATKTIAATATAVGGTAAGASAWFSTKNQKN